ncbi:MAG: ATP-dependent DNA ligase [Hyphomicrobiales bacterium]
MTLPVPLTLKPMEAEPVDKIPTGDGWLYEPKYDGFRCIAFRDAASVHLQSKNQRPLERYFPELAQGLAALPATRFVLDGEIVVEGEPFETLQLRLHPAQSRIEKLAAQFPATLIAFDLLVDGDGRDLTDALFADRRIALEALLASIGPTASVTLSKATRSAAAARRWIGRRGLDGLVAKDLALPYRPGQRAMQKYKQWKTVDCVVAGLYRNERTKTIDSLLLGLYDTDGALNYVGRMPIRRDAAALERTLAPLIGGSGFTGRAPGGKNRWSGKERTPVPVKPVLVAEVSADHITGEHMRHGARLVRWRHDKPPETCTMDQIR